MFAAKGFYRLLCVCLIWNLTSGSFQHEPDPVNLHETALELPVLRFHGQTEGLAQEWCCVRHRHGTRSRFLDLIPVPELFYPSRLAW